MYNLHLFAGFSRCGSFNIDLLIIFGIVLVLGLVILTRNIKKLIIIGTVTKNDYKYIVYGFIGACMFIYGLYVVLLADNSALSNIEYCRGDTVAQIPEDLPRPSVDLTPQNVQDSLFFRNTQYSDPDGLFTIVPPKGWRTIEVADDDTPLKFVNFVGPNRSSYITVRSDITQADTNSSYQRRYILKNVQEATVTNIGHESGLRLFTSSTNGTMYQIMCKSEPNKESLKTCEDSLLTFMPLK